MRIGSRDHRPKGRCRCPEAERNEVIKEPKKQTNSTSKSIRKSMGTSLHTEWHNDRAETGWLEGCLRRLSRSSRWVSDPGSLDTAGCARRVENVDRQHKTKTHQAPCNHTKGGTRESKLTHSHTKGMGGSRLRDCDGQELFFLSKSFCRKMVQFLCGGVVGHNEILNIKLWNTLITTIIEPSLSKPILAGQIRSMSFMSYIPSVQRSRLRE